MSHIYTAAEQLIGKTPLVRLCRMEKKYGLYGRLYVKLEGCNPGGSAKDRVAVAMLDDAENRGLIQPGATIIEPTSGNTGIGLASVCASRGYKCIIIMPDTMSIERQRLMAAYGAQVMLTPGAEGMLGSIRKAQELAGSIPGSFIPDQFNNPANAQAHYQTTGPEIWTDLDGNVDVFVAGVGTGGTITGVGRYLKERKNDVRIVAVEPARSPLLSGGISGSHGLQGIGANFIPSVLDRDIYDEVFPVSEHDAYRLARSLAKTEGILAGISSGAALFAAYCFAAKEENAGKTIVALLPDSGERYLSTDLYG